MKVKFEDLRVGQKVLVRYKDTDEIGYITELWDNEISRGGRIGIVTKYGLIDNFEFSDSHVKRYIEVLRK